MRRSPDPEQRRRALCDSAIELLAAEGIKGLTHLKVDRAAGVADGSTSFYFRTRSALHLAVAERVAALDLTDLAAATTRHHSDTEPSGLATLVMHALRGKRLKRTKARHELALQASRDGALAAALRHSTDEFAALIRAAVMARQSPQRNADTALVADQEYAVRVFLGGFMLAVAGGDRRVTDAAALDRLILGIVDGVAAGRAGTRSQAGAHP